MTLEAVDRALEQWRDRLAAASRNVSELSELPEYAATRAASGGTGPMGELARSMIATMDELWQGVLLIGAALDRAEQARRGGSRLWRAEEAAAAAMAILSGASISVDLVDTPVLRRRLLGGPRETVTVSPETLLATMDAAFDRVRATVSSIGEAEARAAALQARLSAALSTALGGLPDADAWRSRLQDALLPDPLDRIGALESLAAVLDPAVAVLKGVDARLVSNGQALQGLRAAADRAAEAAERCRAACRTALPAVDATAIAALSGWLDRLRATRAAGRLDACAVGLGNWQVLHNRAATEWRALEEAATQALARRAELVARLGAYRAKHRSRREAGVEATGLPVLETAAKAAVNAAPIDLDAASKALMDYEAALARL